MDGFQGPINNPNNKCISYGPGTPTNLWVSLVNNGIVDPLDENTVTKHMGEV